MRGRHGYGLTAFILSISSPNVEARVFCTAAIGAIPRFHDGRQLGANSAAYCAKWRHVRRFCAAGGGSARAKALYRSRNGTIGRMLDARNSQYRRRADARRSIRQVQ